MNITIRNLQKKLPIRQQKIKRLLRSIASKEATGRGGLITLCLVDDKAIRRLNKLFLKKDTATDVLAFDLSEKKGKLCADIIVSADTALKNSKVYGTAPAFELLLYVAHGALHLFGHDDRTSAQQKAMLKRATSYLRA